MVEHKNVVVSGIRCTGRLHLGNYHGALKQWLALQSDYTCYFFAADLHGLTTHYANATSISADTIAMVEDWLAAGLDPLQCCIFVQSDVPEHAELHLLLSMLTPLSWLERVPTFKEQQQKLQDKELSTYGFLGYPLLQAADILLYHATHVPVGEDQLAHLDLVRRVARRFNNLYGNTPEFISSVEKTLATLAPKTKKRLLNLKDKYNSQGDEAALLEASRLIEAECDSSYALNNYVAGYGEPILTVPQPMLSKVPKFPGIDGQKMSKSYGNTIALTEEPASVSKKIRAMPTDPARVRRTDPGTPDKCPVWQLHNVYSTDEAKAWVQDGCTSASIGCIDCKGVVADAIIAEQAPIIARSKEYKNNPCVTKILQRGAETARSLAAETIVTVKRAINLQR